MTMIGVASRPSDGADPRKTQLRVAQSPSGRMVTVQITGDDRLKLIKGGLPGRWPDVMMARERGDTWEQICRWAKVPPPCPNGCHFKDVATRNGEKWEDAPGGISNLVTERVHDGPECIAFILGYVYAWLETELHELAQRRARFMV